MGESGKTSKISAIIAALCIVIYVLAISSSVVQIIENIGQRRNLAESEFYDLADRATQSAVFLGFMSEAYQDSIKDFIAGSETLLGAIISGSNGEFAFEKQAGSGIAWAGASPRLKTGAFQGEPFYLPLRVEGQRNVNIQAIYSRIDSVVFLRILRNTLLAILAGLALALLTLLVELTRKSQSANRRPANEGRLAEKNRRTPENAPIAIEKKIPAQESILLPDDDQIPAFEPEGSDAAFDDIGFPEEEPEDFPQSPFEPQEDDEEAEAAEDEIAEIEAVEDDTASEDSHEELQDDRHPSGLFTPRGNIGWESYTHDRLASELHRCASFEQDLVYLAMEFRDIKNPDDALYRRLTEEAVNFFASRDLIFEKGENGISIIIPNLNLEQGIAKSEEFRGGIISRLNEPPGSHNYAKIDICIGLSSRSGRLMEADRLTIEANKALEKALADPVSRIVAFKSDPEKYREFIKEH